MNSPCWPRPILLIEDDPDIRDSVREFLESEGYNVVTAENGKIGLEKLHEIEHPCLILLDLFMPVMDGHEFLMHLKAENADMVASLPIIVVTAAPQPKRVLGETSERPVAFVKKPIELGPFLKMVEKHCCDERGAAA